MSAISNLRGFIPVDAFGGERSLGGRWYDADNTVGAIYLNAPMTLLNGAKVQPATASSTNVLGSAIALTYVDAAGTVVEGQYYPGNVTGATNLRVFVTDNPNQLYKYQSTGSVARTVAGRNADINVPSDAGSELTGESRASIADSHATGSAQFRTIDKVDEDDNDWGDDYVNLIGKINQHPYASETGV